MDGRVASLLDFFVDDVLDSAQAAAARKQGQSRGVQERQLLAALLTVRPPRPLPDLVLSELEGLLADEREERGLVDAAALPSLAEDGGTVVDGFPTGKVAFWRGDLTTLKSDAIVNAANKQMLGCFAPTHACIDNAIHKAAGPRLRQECYAYMRARGTDEPTGSPVITGGY